MAGPGGHEVERISVKVVPDTSDFHKKLKAFLDKEEKDTKLTINVELDTKKAEAELKKLAKNLKVTLKVNIDAAGVQAKLDALGKNKAVKVKADVDDAVAKVELDLLTRDRKVNIKADVDKSITSRVGGIFSTIGGLASSVGNKIGGALSGGFNAASSAATGTVSKLSSIGTTMSSIGNLATGVFWAVIIPALAGVVIAAGAVAGALLLAFAPAIFIAAGVAFLALSAKGKGAAQKLKDAFKSVAKTAKGVITDAVQPMTKAITDQIPKLNSWIKTLKGPLKSAFAGAAKYVSTFRLGLQEFVSNTLTGLDGALNNPQTKAAVDGLRSLLNQLGWALDGFFNTLANSGTDFGKTLTALGNQLPPIAVALAGLLGAFAKVSPDLITRLGTALTVLLKALSDPQTLQSLAFLAAMSFDVIIASLLFLADTLHFSVDAWHALKQATSETVSFIVSAWNATVSFVKTLWNGLKAAASVVWSGIKAIVTANINDIKTVVTAIWNGIRSITSQSWNDVKTVVSLVVKGILALVKATWRDLGTVTSTTINGIKSFFSSLGRFVSDVVGGIADTINWIIGKAQTAASWLARINPFGGTSTLTVEDDTNGAPRRPFSPGFPPEPLPMGGLFSFQSDLNGMASAAKSLNRTTFSSASKNTGKSAGLKGVAPKVYQFGDIIADNTPTEESIIKALGYADALYA